MNYPYNASKRMIQRIDKLNDFYSIKRLEEYEQEILNSALTEKTLTSWIKLINYRKRELINELILKFYNHYTLEMQDYGVLYKCK